LTALLLRPQILSEEEAEALKAAGLVVEEAPPLPRVDPEAEWDSLLEEAEFDIDPEDLKAIGFSSVEEALAGLEGLGLPPGLDSDLLDSAAKTLGEGNAGGPRKKREREPREEAEVEREKAVVCTRCHALRHTG
jgi:hypothetical protein